MPERISFPVFASRRLRWPLRAALCLLVLAALATLLPAYSGAVRMHDVMMGMNGLYTGYGASPRLPHLPWALSYEQRAEQAKNTSGLWGDTTHYSRADALRPLVRAHPDNRVYLGYYATQAFGHREAVAEFRAGLALDPDNAQYHYLLARTELFEAWDMRHINFKNPATGENYTYFIKDRARLDRAMAELRAGLGQPRIRRYHQEMLLERFAALPTPRQADGYLYRQMLLWSELLPELSHYRELNRAALYYAYRLIKEGRSREALPYLDTWRRTALQLNEDAFFTIDQMIVRSFVTRNGAQAASLYEMAGRPDLAEQTRQQVARLSAAVPRGIFGGHYGGSATSTVSKYGGVVADNLITMPIPSKYASFADLRPIRTLGYNLIEQTALYALLLILGMLLFGHLWSGWMWSIQCRKQAMKPAVLLPGTRGVVTWVIGAVLLPLGAYVAYTRYSGWAGRQYSAEYNIIHLLIDLGVMLLLMLLLPLLSAYIATRRRCRAAGIPVPSGEEEAGRRAMVAFFAVPWAGCWGWLLLVWMDAVPYELTSLWPFNTGNFLVVTGWILLGLLCLAPLVLCIRQFRAQRQLFATYYGTMTRTLVPAFAVVILLLAGIAMPHLQRVEQQALRQDRLIFIQPGHLLPLAEEAYLADQQAAVRRALSGK